MRRHRPRCCRICADDGASVGSAVRRVRGCGRDRVYLSVDSTQSSEPWRRGHRGIVLAATTVRRRLHGGRSCSRVRQPHVCLPRRRGSGASGAHSSLLASECRERAADAVGLPRGGRPGRGARLPGGRWRGATLARAACDDHAWLVLVHACRRRRTPSKGNARAGGGFASVALRPCMDWCGHGPGPRAHRLGAAGLDHYRPRPHDAKWHAPHPARVGRSRHRVQLGAHPVHTARAPRGHSSELQAAL